MAVSISGKMSWGFRLLLVLAAVVPTPGISSCASDIRFLKVQEKGQRKQPSSNSKCQTKIHGTAFHQVTPALSASCYLDPPWIPHRANVPLLKPFNILLEQCFSYCIKPSWHILPQYTQSVSAQQAHRQRTVTRPSAPPLTAGTAFLILDRLTSTGRGTAAGRSCCHTHAAGGCGASGHSMGCKEHGM